MRRRLQRLLLSFLNRKYKFGHTCPRCRTGGGKCQAFALTSLFCPLLLFSFGVCNLATARQATISVRHREEEGRTPAKGGTHTWGPRCLLLLSLKSLVIRSPQGSGECLLKFSTREDKVISRGSAILSRMGMEFPNTTQPRTVLGSRFALALFVAISYPGKDTQNREYELSCLPPKEGIQLDSQMTAKV